MKEQADFGWLRSLNVEAFGCEIQYVLRVACCVKYLGAMSGNT
jgi:hypothetical protein